MEENDRAVTESLLLTSEEEAEEIAEAMREVVVIESNSATATTTGYIHFSFFSTGVGDILVLLMCQK